MKPHRLRLRIRREDVDPSKARSPDECPLANAALRATGAPWAYFDGWVLYVGRDFFRCRAYRGSQRAVDLAERFDNGIRVRPTTVVLARVPNRA